MDSTTTYGTTLLQLRNTIRARCNMSGSTGPDQFVPDPELNQYINASYGEFRDYIMRLNERNYLTSSTYTFPSTGSVANWSPLPQNFAVMAGVERSLDGTGAENSWFDIRKFEFNQRNWGNNSTWPLMRAGVDVRYQVYDWNLVLQPADAAVGLFRIWYYPQPPLLVNDTDTFDDERQWYEFVVVDCCIKVLAKQGEDVSVFAAQKQNMIERIRTMAGDRDYGSPKLYGRKQTNAGAWNPFWRWGTGGAF